MSVKMNATIFINQKSVSVEWANAAARELAKRTQPLVVELELYFSCLVKKFVHFHDVMPERKTAAASDKLSLFFRPVTKLLRHVQGSSGMVSAYGYFKHANRA